MTENREPIVSVIIPCRNGEKFVEGAVRSALRQTVGELEVLVIDDGSEDSSAMLAERMAKEDQRVRIIKNPVGIGAAAARNLGIGLSRGAYIAFLDCDDLWLPEKLEKQLRRMEESGAGLCCTSYAIVDERGERLRGDYVVPAEFGYEDMLRENLVGCSSVLLKREALGEKRFPTGFYHEDYALWLSLMKDGCASAACTEVLTKWRLHKGSRSFGKLNSACSRWKIYRGLLGFETWKSAAYMLHYALAGIRKYGRKV